MVCRAGFAPARLPRGSLFPKGPLSNFAKQGSREARGSPADTRYAEPDTDRSGCGRDGETETSIRLPHYDYGAARAPRPDRAAE